MYSRSSGSSLVSESPIIFIFFDLSRALRFFPSTGGAGLEGGVTSPFPPPKALLGSTGVARRLLKGPLSLVPRADRMSEKAALTGTA